MKAWTKYSLAAVVAAAGTLAAGSVWAAVSGPADVPEPGTFGLAAAGLAGVLLAARLSRRSK